MSLPGTTGVEYALSVFNAAPANQMFNQDGTATGTGNLAALVWNQPSLTSTQFGNGAGGDLSYVGPCDAQGPNNTRQNYVALALKQIAVASGGSINGTGPSSPASVAAVFVGSGKILDDEVTSGVANTESPADPDFVNPCDYLAPCVLAFACNENEDTEVVFNLTVMRDAEQGFFDIAVNFEDIFCSAKIDSCYDVQDAEFIELLFDENGDRVETAVMATACTAGTDDANTVMWMSLIEVSCNDGAVTFNIDPTGDNSNDPTTDGEPGNHCIDLDLGGGGTAGTHASGTITFINNDMPAVGATCRSPNGNFYVMSDSNTADLVMEATAEDVGTDSENWQTQVISCISPLIFPFPLPYSETSGAITGGEDPEPGGPSTAEICYALYWGGEDLICDPPGVPCNKLYWNLAINLDDLSNAGLTDCNITAGVTASSTSDVSPPTFVNGQLPGPGQSYGYIGFNAALNDSAGDPECFKGPMGSDLAEIRYGTTPDLIGGDDFPQLCYSLTQGNDAPQTHAYPDCGGGSCAALPGAFICHGQYWPVCSHGVTYQNACHYALACGSANDFTEGACP